MEKAAAAGKKSEGEEPIAPGASKKEKRAKVQKLALKYRAQDPYQLSDSSPVLQLHEHGTPETTASYGPDKCSKMTTLEKAREEAEFKARQALYDPASCDTLPDPYTMCCLPGDPHPFKLDVPSDKPQYDPSDPLQASDE